MLAALTTDSLVILDPKKATSTPPISCPLSSPTAATWTPDNSALFVLSSAGIQKLDAQGTPLEHIYETQGDASSIVFKGKENTIIFSTNTTVTLVDAGSKQVAHQFDSHKSPILSLSLSSDASLLASIASDAVRIHNLLSNTTTSLRGLPLSAGNVTACAFHPHLRTRLLLGIGNLLVIYETNRPSGPSKTITVDKENAGKIVAITSSPFSKTLIAVGFSGGMVGLVDLEKEKG